MKLTFLSDTHLFHRDSIQKIILTDYLQGGPILIHSGDVSGRGTLTEIREFLDWFSVLPYTHKIFIAGNHDFAFEVNPKLTTDLLKEYPGVTYLNDSAVTIEGIKFWGSPVTPYFHNWAFNRHFPDIGFHWLQIPKSTDVLITHGPPKGILDKTRFTGEHTGCPVLLEKIKEIKPKVHVFGHIHEGRGMQQVGPTLHINASSLDLNYRIVTQPPFELEWYNS